MQKWLQKEEEERRGREKNKASDNTHIHNLQQGGTEEMQETKRLMPKEHSYWSSSLRWFVEA